MSDKTSDKRLLPCPFCGGEAILESDGIGKGKELWYVSCKSDCVTQYGYSTTREGSIEKWNTRKPVERILERLEERIRIYKNTSDINVPMVDVATKEAERIIEIIKEEVQHD